MPSRRLPNTTPAVLRTLKTARDTYLATADPADRAITPAQFAQLDPADPGSLLNRFLKECSEVDLAQAAQSPLTTALSLAAARLTTLCSHFHQVLDLAIARSLFPLGDRAFYGRDASAASIPALESYDAVQETAEAIVKGEADRHTAAGPGFIAMAMPSAAEIATALAPFKTARTASKAAQTKTDHEREDVQALYPEAQELAVDICDTVEFFYRADKDPASRRAKSRRWGVVYLYGEGEPPDPGDAPAPVTPTP